MKRVLFVIVDALTSRVVGPAMQRGELPTFQALADAGAYRDECISVFPSITPAATASLVTGHYPSKTSIAGACWYDRTVDQVAYHGDDVWAIWNHGVTEYFRGFLTRMNFERLRCDTLYEIASANGQTSACFNLMWFRGPCQHAMNKPWLLDLITGGEMPSEISGPDRLLLGDFVQSLDPNGAIAPEIAGFGGEYGFRDETTSAALVQAFERDELASINVAYFPTNDFRSHEVGPLASLSVVQKVDQTLGRLIEIAGGLESFLERFTLLMTGDHSHSETAALPERSIKLDDLLKSFKIAKAGSAMSPDDDLVAGPNMRSVNFYCRDVNEQRPVIVERLLSDKRVDQTIWSDENGIHVRTATHGTLHFWPDAGGTPDVYGGRWKWAGALETVDGSVDDGCLKFDEYPNAFERLWQGVNDLSGDLWATSLPGFEFERPSTATHEGGSHGSLHRDDSIAPLIVAGLDQVEVPHACRVVDLVPMIVASAGFAWTGPAVGESRQ